MAGHLFSMLMQCKGTLVFLSAVLVAGHGRSTRGGRRLRTGVARRSSGRAAPIGAFGLSLHPSSQIVGYTYALFLLGQCAKLQFLKYSQGHFLNRVGTVGHDMAGSGNGRRSPKRHSRRACASPSTARSMMVGQVSGADGRLPIRSRCEQIYDYFHSFIPPRACPHRCDASPPRRLSRCDASPAARAPPPPRRDAYPPRAQRRRCDASPPRRRSRRARAAAAATRLHRDAAPPCFVTSCCVPASSGAIIPPCAKQRAASLSQLACARNAPSSSCAAAAATRRRVTASPGGSSLERPAASSALAASSASRAVYGFCHAAERRAEPSVCTRRFQDDMERHHFRDWVRK